MASQPSPLPNPSSLPTPVGGFGTYEQYRAAQSNTSPPSANTADRGVRPLRSTTKASRRTRRDKARDAARVADEMISEAVGEFGEKVSETQLAGFVRREFEMMRRHRDTSGISARFLHCLRAFNGEYSPAQLAEIQKISGSVAFARITAVKCRTLAALLSELYLGNDRPWMLEPTPEPNLPDSIHEDIKTMANAKAQADGGADPETIEIELYEDAVRAAKERAFKEAEKATSILDDELVEGEFYAALAAFIHFFTIFPLSILKGPFFRASRKVKYQDGVPQVVLTTVQAFAAPNPFDVWFSPGVANPDDGSVIERIRFARQDLERLALIEGGVYDADAIRSVLATHPNGFAESFVSSVEEGRRQEEGRESPLLNDAGLYDVMEYHGWVRGDVLLSDPLTNALIAADASRDIDALTSYHCTIRTLSAMVLSVQFNPDPLERTIYHTASFEEVPGSVYGRGLPEALTDSQSLANTALRSLINNLAMASGPMVGISRGVLGEAEAVHEIFPWKVWDFVADPAAPTAQPIIFFQPQDNSGSMMNVLEKAMQLADETSAIPRYAAGSERAGGAARTASGLAQLQGNVARQIRHVAKSIDTQVIAPVVSYIYDIKLLTDTTGRFRGDETIRAMGVQAAQKAETERMRAMEMLQVTANPIDAQLLGPDGRLMLLEEVANNLGFDQRKLAQALSKRRAELARKGVDPTENPANSGNQPQAPAAAAPGVAAPVAGMTQTRTPETMLRAVGGPQQN
jgi:hypothetical protein